MVIVEIIYPRWRKDASFNLSKLLTDFDSKLFSIRIFMVCIVVYRLKIANTCIKLGT
jgi:hypothetical protein